MSPASGDGGPREGLRRKRSEGRLRTPVGWRRLDRPSRLWKTLKSVALQGNAQDHENTGVSAIGGGCAARGKGIRSVAAWNACPDKDAHPQARAGAARPSSPPRPRGRSYRSWIVNSDQMPRGCPFGPGRLARLRLARSRQSGADPFLAAPLPQRNRVKPPRCWWPDLARMGID